MTFRSAFPVILLLVVAVGVGVVRCSSGRHEETQKTANGARSDSYVDDALCRGCHLELAMSFEDVGMARSFSRPRKEEAIEDFDAPPYFHEPSGRYYEMFWRGEDLVFRRYQRDEAGARIHTYEARVDWIVGSGNATRSYLVHNDAGELHQLPLDWYTQDRVWRMAPGYDDPQHQGVQRQIRRECLFCHNAYPEFADGEDASGMPHRFPENLPEGIGCQRCHGPGAAHVDLALRGGSSRDVRRAIVNPARLPIEERDSVCYQCHLLPAVAMIGPRRLDRGDYSFRPGERLSDYMFHLEVVETARSEDDRFEINHHAYRLRQSECFQEAGGELTCISCHDPHRKVSQAERASHYAAVCLDCHQAHEVEAGEVDAGDCVRCHMPRRRTQDVVHVIMTDHRIQIPSERDLLAPRSEVEPEIESISFYRPEMAPRGPEREVYQILTLLQTRPTEEMVERLKVLLEENPGIGPAPRFALARGQSTLGQLDAAEQTVLELRKLRPDDSRLAEWLGTIYVLTGRDSEAREVLVHALRADPLSPELHLNLGVVESRLEKPESARRSLERAVELRPVMTSGWWSLGRVLEQLGEIGEAERSYRRALEIDPGHTRSYLSLVELLEHEGRSEEAQRMARHGLRYAGDPGQIERLLAKLSL